MIFKYITLLLVLHFTQQQTDSNTTNTQAQNSTQIQNNTETGQDSKTQNANLTNAQIRMLSENYGTEDYRIVKDACRKQCQLKKKIQQIDWVWTQYNPMNPYIYKDAPKKDKQYLTRLFTEMINSKGIKQERYEHPQQDYKQDEYPNYNNDYDRPKYQETYQQNEYPTYQQQYQQKPKYQETYQQNEYPTYQQQYYDKN